MTLIQHDAVLSWTEPDSVLRRGTLFVLPGRGESPAVYERFGRRMAADAYRVHALPAPTDDPAAVTELVAALVASADTNAPRVLVGSDAGALFAAGLVAQSTVAAVSGLVLAGLPTVTTTAAAAGWEGELDVRTSCSAHRARITAAGVRPGELYREIPAQWLEAAVPETVDVPVLGLHGSVDAVSSLDDARSWYARAPRAELFSVAGGRHDALNDQTHRSAAATVVLFLERLRLSAELSPIVIPQPLGAAADPR